jgi:hypothetical protein
MKTHNPENERTKRRYFAYLKEAKRFSDVSLDGVAKALNRFEVYTHFKEFRAFHIEQAVAFKRHLPSRLAFALVTGSAKPPSTPLLTPSGAFSSGWLGNRATVRGWPMPMPTTLTCQKRKHGLRRRFESSVCQHSNRSSTSSSRCRRSQ